MGRKGCNTTPVFFNQKLPILTQPVRKTIKIYEDMVDNRSYTHKFRPQRDSNP